MPVGKVSFELWLLFTSSFGWINRSPSPSVFPARTCARFAITSFVFILLCVPEPVCQTTNGNWSLCLPSRISSHTAPIRSRFSSVKTPASQFAYAAAFFKNAKPSMISRGIVPAGPILKLLRERSVCAPQYLSAGTFTSPMVSCSILYSIVIMTN